MLLFSSWCSQAFSLLFRSIGKYYMDSQLEDYRAKKRRQATINNVKDKLFNMVSFQQVKSDLKNEHVTTEEVILK